MPIPKTIRVNPLDLQKNIIIGITLPFNAPGVFNYSYSTKDQIKSNLINLLITNKGERILNPDFGADIGLSLFDGITDDTAEVIRQKIITAVSTYIPQITLNNISFNSNIDDNILNILVGYTINISGEADQVTIQFT